MCVLNSIVAEKFMHRTANPTTQVQILSMLQSGLHTLLRKIQAFEQLKLSNASILIYRSVFLLHISLYICCATLIYWISSLRHTALKLLILHTTTSLEFLFCCKSKSLIHTTMYKIVVGRCGFVPFLSDNKNRRY